MELKGKVIVGAIGAFWGLWGMVIGAALGHYLVDRPAETRRDTAFSAYQKRQSRFLYHVFTLCAKIAKAKGKVVMEDIQLMEILMRHHFRLNDKGRDAAVKIWRQSKESDAGFDEAARAFFEEFRTERHHILNMLDLMFQVAAADRHLHAREERLLQVAASVFQVNRLQFDRIKQQYFHVEPPQLWQPLDPHYALLGARPDESLDSIKKKWRALAMQWHPDKATAAGASANQISHAQKKFQEINEAYETILKAKGG